MKPRGTLIGIVCALAAFSSAPGVTPRALGKPNAAALLSKKITLSSFKLEGSDGYEIEVDGLRFENARSAAVVKVQAGLLASSYTVKADQGPGIHAIFGELGALGVSFQRHKRKIFKPEPGCRWVTEGGVFRGSFHFTGENGYVSAEAIDPAGEVFRLPNGFCGLGNFRPGLPDLGLEATTLRAQGRGIHGPITFEASRFKGGKTVSFSASLQERIGPMKISRSAGARGARNSLTNTGTSRATASPPLPFVGSAHFIDPAHGPVSWTGDLSVPFLGAPETALTGETFDARLCPNFSILNTCKL